MYKFRKDIVVLIGCIISIIGIVLPFAKVVNVSFCYLISFIGFVNLLLLISTWYFFKTKNRSISLINLFLLTLLFIRIIILALINGYKFKIGIYLYIIGYIFIIYGFRKVIFRFFRK